MCLLVVSSPNSTPRKKDLDNASCNNPHGFGYAVIAGNKIITGKGMNSKKVIKEFLEVRKQYPNSYAMYHARFATHGVKNDENCHPFKVDGSDLTYLAHNGILDVHIEPTDKRSDTRIFAETGVKDLFKHILHLVCKYQDKERIVRMRGKFVSIDPREWSNEYDLTVNVGLGTGNREQQMAMVAAILQKQTSG